MGNLVKPFARTLEVHGNFRLPILRKHISFTREVYQEIKLTVRLTEHLLIHALLAMELNIFYILFKL